SCINFHIGGITTHVDDECFAARPQDAVHLGQSADWVAEVFEGRAATHEIEAIVCEWQCRGIALSELDLYARSLCIGRRHTHARSADIEARDLMGANPGQFDR